MCVRVPVACHVCRLNDLRHFCQLLLPHTFAILFLLTVRMSVASLSLLVCFFRSLYVCVCVISIKQNQHSHTHVVETWQKQQRMPHTFVFIMLNVSWGQQDHTHTRTQTTLTKTTTVTCAVCCLFLLLLLLLFGGLLFCFRKCSTFTACVCHISHFTFVQFQLQLHSHFVACPPVCFRCVFYFTRAPKSMQRTTN